MTSIYRIFERLFHTEKGYTPEKSMILDSFDTSFLKITTRNFNLIFNDSS